MAYTSLRRNFWASWYDLDTYPQFDSNLPSWCTGWRMRDNARTIVCAVKAENEDAVKAIIRRAYGFNRNIEFRFIEQRPNNWEPFNERFQREDWMEWGE